MLLADILKGVVPEKSWLEGAGHKIARMCEFGFFHGLGAIINLRCSDPNSMSSKSATAFSHPPGF